MLLIAINIFTYHNLTLINTNFISVLYKNLAPVKLYPRLLHVLIIVQNIFLYIISPSTQFNIFPFCSCFLNTWETRKVLQTNIHLWQFVFIQIVTFINALYSFLSIWVTVQWFYFFFFSVWKILLRASLLENVFRNLSTFSHVGLSSFLHAWSIVLLDIEFLV